MNDIIKINADESKLIGHFGSADSFRWLMERQAEIYQVPLNDVERYADVRGALVKATQMSWTYGVMPGKHIYLIPFSKEDGGVWRKTYAVADSYEWRKASADDKARENGWRYMVQSEQMSAAEVKAYVTSNNLDGAYADQDRGVKARVLMLHEIEICKLMDQEYNPPWHYGFWRKNAKKKNGKGGSEYWEADTVPSGRTPDWVALKRAEKSALAQHFELRPLGGWSQKSAGQKKAMIEDHVTQVLPEPQSSAPGATAMIGHRGYDADFYGDDEVDAAPVTMMPEPESEADETCPECFAPPGRPHATKCSHR